MYSFHLPPDHLSDSDLNCMITKRDTTAYINILI